MRDFINIGPVPCGESCAQVGQGDFEKMSRLECFLFLDQLRRAFPEPDRGRLAVKSFSHDFGTYREVVAYYDTEDEESTNWAFEIEANAPENWDEQAREALLDALKPENFYA